MSSELKAISFSKIPSFSTILYDKGRREEKGVRGKMSDRYGIV